MNWDAISASAELIAAIGVIISLIYLAIQMRGNAIAIRRASARQTMSDNNAALRAIIATEEMAGLVLRGYGSMDDLSDVERYRFDLAFGQWLLSVEQSFADHEDGILPDSTLVLYRNVVPAFLSTPGGLAWREERKVWYGPDFRKLVESLLKAPPPHVAAAGPKLD